MFNILKTAAKHVTVWFMIMCLSFFAAAPIARTDLNKWLVVAFTALAVAEISIFIVERGTADGKEAAQ